MTTKQHAIIRADFDPRWKSTRVTYECGHSSILPGEYTTADTHPCSSGCVATLDGVDRDGAGEFHPSIKWRFAPIEPCGCYAYVKCRCGILSDDSLSHGEHIPACPVSRLEVVYQANR